MYMNPKIEPTISETNPVAFPAAPPCNAKAIMPKTIAANDSQPKMKNETNAKEHPTIPQTIEATL